MTRMSGRRCRGASSSQGIAVVEARAHSFSRKTCACERRMRPEGENAGPLGAQKYVQYVQWLVQEPPGMAMATTQVGG